MTHTTVLIDGSNLVMRAIHGMARANLSAGGVNTGPLLATVNGLSKVVREESPDALMVTWDGGNSPLRTALYPNYKSNRRRQRTPEEKDYQDGSYMLVKEFMTLAGVQHLGRNAVEADDLISMVWGRLTGQRTDKLVIVSNDHDFEQLLGDNPNGVPTELLRLGSADTPTDRWTHERLVREKGYTAAAVPLILALAGDPGDGIPGVPRVGPKTAIKLLEANGWDLDKVIEARPDAELAKIYYQLVDLRTQAWSADILATVPSVAPWNPTVRTSLAWSDLLNFLHHYELRTVVDRLVQGELWLDAPRQPFGRRFSLR